MSLDLGDSDVDGGLAISEVSERLGVPMPTLRSWELRYGIPAGERPAGSHRRYFPEQLRALRLMRDEISRGLRAGAAARSVRAQLSISGSRRDLLDEFLAASQSNDPPAMRTTLKRAADILGPADAIDGVLMPAMRQIGVWWMTGRCDQKDEHLATESVRSWLSVMTSFAPPPIHTAPILLSCGPADLHTIGIESLALLMRYQLWSSRSLGAHVSSSSLLTSAQGAGAAAVVLVSHLATARQRAIESLRAVDRTGIPLFYAGNAFTTSSSRAGLPGFYLGTSLGAASRILNDKLLSNDVSTRQEERHTLWSAWQ